MKDVKLSVCVVTYNHEALIEQCLRSILDQQVNFSFEIIVSDDASTDSTPQIIKRFQEQYPEIIRPFFHEKNIHAGVNFQFAHDQARGEYVAHCDGDDYFLPGKLQRQVDFLDTHPDHVQVWHRQQLVDHDNKVVGQFPFKFKASMLGKKLRLENLAVSYGLVGQHSSQMYRRSARTIYKEKVPRIDYFYALDIGANGYSTHLNEFLGAYRTGNASTLTTTSNGKKFVEKALGDAALFYTEKFGLGKAFYGNLWVRRFMAVYERSIPSEALQEAISVLSKYKTISYRIKSLKVVFYIHSSANPGRIIRNYIKRFFSRKKPKKQVLPYGR